MRREIRDISAFFPEGEAAVWHAVAPVSSAYDPILYESPEPAAVLVLNAGPATVTANAWSEIAPLGLPAIHIELHPGDQRVISGCLVRAKYKASAHEFAAIAWRVLR